MRKSSRIPNFRNLGIHLRVMLLHLCLWGLLTVYQAEPGASALSWVNSLTEIASQWLPPLLLVLGALTLWYPRMRHWPYAAALAAIFLLATGLTAWCAWVYNRWIVPLSATHYGQLLGLCLGDVLLCLYYLDLLQRAYSPAIAEARLQALQARIRPHFLFNSLNAALSLIRSQPQRAEQALEDLAELFRVLMADNRALVPLTQEIALCRQYLAIEALRLECRLQCDWQCSDVPPSLMIPPLILQPLVENAVYHGIEPQPAGGVIQIQVQLEAGSVLLRISNPLPPVSDRAGGNKMAINNIRERLRLHYDLEAQLRQYTTAQQYVVEISLPTRPHAEVMHG